jgi:hypothetical protein
VKRVRDGHHQDVFARKAAAAEDLVLRIAARTIEPAAALTGWFVRHEDIYRIA